MGRIIDGKKKCTTCLEVKLVESFGPNKKIKCGLHSTCRSCTNENIRVLRLSKKEHFKKYGQEYRDKNRERINSYNRKYHQAKNPLFGQPVTIVRNNKGQFSKKLDTVIN